MSIIGFDLETSSEADLTKVGGSCYIAHPSTRALMFAWTPLGTDYKPWLWLEGDPIPEGFIESVHENISFSGWNVMGFDRLGYQTLLVERWGFPPIYDGYWIDSMHAAAAANLPRGLAPCAKAIGFPFEEDLKDNARVKRITNAVKTPIPFLVSDILNGRVEIVTDKKLIKAAKEENRPIVSQALFDDLQWLANRCVQDVIMEAGVLQALPPWPQMEPWRFMPHIDRRINDAGILLDVKLAEGLALAAEREKRNLNEKMSKLTGGAVNAVTKVEVLKQWLVNNGVELPDNTIEDEYDEFEEEDNPETEEDEAAAASKGARKSPWKLRKSDVADLIARDDVPEACRLALAIRSEGNKVSASKFRTMLARASSDGRMRGSMSLGGAQQTMRWASPGANLYNTVRDVFGNADEVAETHNLNTKTDKAQIHRLQNEWLREAIEIGCTGDPEVIRARYETTRKDAQGRLQPAGVMTWISRMTRRTLSAQRGKVLLNGDYSQIEARVTDWLAQQIDMLDAWGTKQDVYKVAAEGIFHIPRDDLTKGQRQSGKVTKLACGFGGGMNALLTMALNQGVMLTGEEAKTIVHNFRETNDATQKYWYATDDAAANAVLHPGREFPVPPLGLVSYFMDPTGLDCLCCRLPSGRLLRYWAPRLRQGYWDKARTQPKKRLSLSGLTVKGRAVFRRSLYHCTGVENQVQATAADILGHGLDNADRNGIPVVLHVYDSAAAEVDEDKADALLAIFRQCMLDQASWTYGLPMDVDVDIGPRFG